MTEHKRAFSVTKQQLRELLGTNGLPMPPTTFRKYWRQHGLHTALGLDEKTFANRKVFFGEEFNTLKTVIGFDDSDLIDL